MRILRARTLALALGAALVLATPAPADPPRLVLDAATDLSGAEGSNPRQLTSLGGAVVFVADDERAERLWRSDGTLLGTYPLGPACDPGPIGVAWRRVGLLGDVALFSFFCAGDGTTLWRTDGTAAGTLELLDYSPGDAVISAVDFASALFFLEDTLASGGGSERLRLWRTDGTVEGTLRVVDRALGAPSSFGLPAAANDRIEVVVRPVGAPVELWASGGTTPTTHKVTTLDDPFISEVLPEAVPFGRHIAWRSFTSQLWVSDGTAAGTGPVTSFSDPGDALDSLKSTAYGDELFFVATEAAGDAIWRTDGTLAGTRRVVVFDEPFALTSFNLGPRFLVPLGERIVFYATGASSGARLLALEPATGALEELAAPCAPSQPIDSCPHSLWLERVGDRVVFPLRRDARGDIATSDGTAAGTFVEASLCPSGCVLPPYTPTAVDAEVFGILARSWDALELWSIDANGEVTLRGGGFSRLGVEWEGPLEIARAGDLVLLSAADARHGIEPFRSVVPGADLELVEDLKPDAASSTPEPGVELDGDLYLGLDGRVYRTRGTPETTRELLHPPVGSCGPSGPESTAALRPLPGRMLIGTGACVEETSLWSYDPLGDDLVTLFGAERPDRPWFRAIAASTGLEADLFAGAYSPGEAQLWTTDGTDAGTRFRVSLPDAVGSLFRLGELRFLHADRLYLWQPGDPAPEPVTGAERDWWTPLGGAGGRAIYLAGDFSPTQLDLYGVGSDATAERLAQFPDPTEFLGRAEHEGLLVFVVERSSDLALELWVTDGTPSGTLRLREFGERISFGGGDILPLGDRLAFLANSTAGRTELWATDGTDAGTGRLDGVGDGTSPTFVYTFVSTGQRVFVLGRPTTPDGVVTESRILWSSAPEADGGAVAAAWGTTEADRVHELDWPRLLWPLGDRVYFARRSAGSGGELWSSDGTITGTGRVADIFPGAESSWPAEFDSAGGRLYFSADDGLRGRELWTFDPGDATLCRESPRALCLSGDRFRVEAFWTDFEGNQGDAIAVSVSADSGAFWFFDPANVELVAKVLDGTVPFGHHWVFYGALSNVRYAVTVRDGATGAARRYVNPAGRYASVGDCAAFGPLGADATAAEQPPELVETLGTTAGERFAGAVEASGACVPGPHRLCLLEGRFAVEAAWRDFQGNTGVGGATPWTGGESGTFWFFDPGNVELIVKVLDGTGVNGRYWVYFGALSNVEYELTVTDTLTGAVRIYANPPGTFASVGDVWAF